MFPFLSKVNLWLSGVLGLIIIVLGSISYIQHDIIENQDQQLDEYKDFVKQINNRHQMEMDNLKKKIITINKEHQIEDEVDKIFNDEGNPEMVESLAARGDRLSKLLRKLKNRVCSTKEVAKYKNIKEEKNRDEECYFDGVGWHLPKSTYGVQ